MRQFYKNILVGAVVAAGVAYGPVGQALPVEHYAASSRLAEGKWYKVPVSVDGIQFVSNEALKAMGFTDPASVNAYGYGGRKLSTSLNSAMEDDLPLQPTLHTAEGIYFFGVGTVRWGLKGSRIAHEQNNYGTTSYYFLSDRALQEGEGQMATQKVSYGSDDQRLTTFTNILLHEQDLNSTGHTGGDLFGEDFRATSSRTFTFDLPGAVDENVDYFVVFAAKSGGGSTATCSVGGEEIGSLRFSANTSDDTHTSLRSAALEGWQTEPGKGALTISHSGTGVVHNAYLDYIEASYTASLTLGSEPLVWFHNVPASGRVVFSVSGVGSDTSIWDVTDPSLPVEVQYDREGSTALFAPQGAGLRRYVAFNPGQRTAEPGKGTSVANQDIHAMEIPNLVIISPKEYTTQANRIADMHRETDSMTVHVFTPEQVYNEFSSGTADVTAFRRMAKMWWDRGASLPENQQIGNILLLGRATYDQRMLTETLRATKYPRVLSWVTVADPSNGSASITETNSYLSDNYIGMLEDTDNFQISRAKMSIGVGRMPVKSASEAKTMTDKLINFVTAPDQGAWKNNVLLLADDGDNAAHAEQTQSMYNNMWKNDGDALLYERMYIDAYDLGTGSFKRSYPEAKSRMLKLLEEGVGLWSYIGHANPTSLTGDDMWNYSDLTTMTNPHWPVFYSASCEFVRFDSDAISGCETMWLTPKAGIIAAVAANRKVYISNNGLMSNAFGENYFKRGADGLPRTLGTVYKDAINRVGNDDNKHRFAIMGDPAMRVPMPKYDVHVDTFNDVDVSAITDAADYPVIPGLSRVKVTGSVLDAGGNLMTDFTGTVTPTLYDAEVVVTTKGHVTDTKYPDGKEISYNDRRNRLFTGSFPVKEGKWEATLLLPEEIENNFTQARLTLYAWPDTKECNVPLTSDAGGATDRFYIYGWDETAIEDKTDPVIEYMYLNNSAFRSGYTVGPDPVFKAKVSDESGINISTSGIGRLLTVTVDGNKVFDNLADYYTTDSGDPTTGLIAYPLTGLGLGEHFLEFLVWDNAGNSTRSGFKFTIAEHATLPELDIYTDASPAISSVTLYINSAEAVAGTAEVFDLSGRILFFQDSTMADGGMATTWNLCDGSGNRVPRGIYLYRATVRDSAGTETRRTIKFAVGNP